MVKWRFSRLDDDSYSNIPTSVVFWGSDRLVTLENIANLNLAIIVQIRLLIKGGGWEGGDNS